MRFSYLLTAFLAGLSIASPIPNPEPAGAAELEVRGHKGGGGHPSHGGHGGSGGKGGGKGGKAPTTPKIVETDAYKAVHAQHHALEKDKWYYFTQETPLGQSIPGDAETKTEMQQLQHRLGFEHTAVVVGQVTHKETGINTKNHKITKDFSGTLYDMIKLETPVNGVEDRSRSWRVNHQKRLKYGGHISSANKAAHKRVAKIGSDYVKEHDRYNLDSNNCNTFAQHMMKEL